MYQLVWSLANKFVFLSFFYSRIIWVPIFNIPPPPSPPPNFFYNFFKRRKKKPRKQTKGKTKKKQRTKQTKKTNNRRSSDCVESCFPEFWSLRVALQSVPRCVVFVFFLRWRRFDLSSSSFFFVFFSCFCWETGLRRYSLLC